MGNTLGKFTSWTRDISIAEKFAGETGVVLQTRISVGRMIASPDIWLESEVLVSGVITGAKVIPYGK